MSSDKPIDKTPDELHLESEGLDETWLTDEQEPEIYNWSWRKVIVGMMDGKPGYQAYADAYDIDTSNEKSKRVAEANCSRLLSNAKFTTLWRKVLTEVGFNEQVADSQLIKLMTDDTVNPAVRRAAIRDFNELHGRIIKRTDLTSKGEKLPVSLVEFVGDEDDDIGELDTETLEASDGVAATTDSTSTQS